MRLVYAVRGSGWTNGEKQQKKLMIRLEVREWRHVHN